MSLFDVNELRELVAPVLVDECTIYDVELSDFDQDTGTYDEVETEVYSGPCMVYVTGGLSERGALGSATVGIYGVLIPGDVEGIKANQKLIVDGSASNQDLVGKEMKITSVGQETYNVVYNMTMESWEPSS